MITCVAVFPFPHLFSLWASTCNISIPHLFLVLLDRSSIPVSIYDCGVLVARSATYRGF